MGEDSGHKILQRKARAGREEHQARVMSPARALRLALARAADDRFDLALSVSGIHAAVVTQDPLISSVDDDMLIVLLDGPAGALGVAALDLQLLSGLIEVQTMGEVRERRADPRPTTQTDGAIAAPLLDAMLVELADNLSGVDGADWASDYRFGARVESARMLGLVLEAPEFHQFRLQVDLGGGAKRGELVLALPTVAPDEVVEGDSPPGKAQASASTPAAPVLGQGAALEAETSLDVVLCRMQMSVSQLADMKVGDMLKISREALNETRLEAGKDHLLSQGRLGQINGFRALRLVPQPGRDTPLGDGADRVPLDGAERGALSADRGEGVVQVLPAPGGSAGADRGALGQALPDGAGARVTGLSQDDTLPTMQDVADVSDLPDLSDLPGLNDGEAGDGLNGLLETALDAAQG